MSKRVVVAVGGPIGCAVAGKRAQRDAQVNAVESARPGMGGQLGRRRHAGPISRAEPTLTRFGGTVS